MPLHVTNHKRPVRVSNLRTKMARSERQLPYRLKATTDKAQSWAEWWAANVTQEPDKSQHLRYRTDLADICTLTTPITSRFTEDALLSVARREAWERRKQPNLSQQYQSLPRSAIACAAPTVNRLARSNVVENMSDAVTEQTRGAVAVPAGTSKGWQQPSLQLIGDATAECSDAIREYMLKFPRNNIPWTEEDGIRLQPGDRFIPDGLMPEEHKAVMDFYLGRLPGGFAALDASRPWMLYWVLNALATMKLGFTDIDGVVASLTTVQNRQGGFGGGHGQHSHLATTYAAILALVCCGLPEEAMTFVDRRELYEWLGRLKQSNGAFAMAEGGEVDNRAVYIVVVLVNLLNLPRELPASSPARAHGHTLFSDGIGHFIRQCQTYEGGIGCNPNTEAHGAYTFCGMAALCLLDEEQGPANLHQYLDFDALLQWVHWRQEDITGGLAGRTNKVVDNCYSHWIGDCWPLLENALPGNPELFNRDALALYILTAGQDPDGGLRDKPSKSPDAYHSCYGLAGLSMTMWHWTFDKGEWSYDLFDADLLDPPTAPLHPLYCVPMDCAEAARKYFLQRPLFQ